MRRHPEGQADHSEKTCLVSSATNRATDSLKQLTGHRELGAADCHLYVTAVTAINDQFSRELFRCHQGQRKLECLEQLLTTR
jgi:hypothetical protein